MSDDGRGNGKRGKAIWALLALSMLCFASGCGGSDATARALPTPMTQPAVSVEPRATPDPGTNSPAPVCPQARGEGTIPPAVSIYSITFAVNGLDQVVRAGDTLQASPGDEIGRSWENLSWCGHILLIEEALEEVSKNQPRRGLLTPEGTVWSRRLKRFPKINPGGDCGLKRFPKINPGGDCGLWDCGKSTPEGTVRDCGLWDCGKSTPEGTVVRGL